MCDPECVKRFESMELELATITADIKWIKGMCAICVVIVGTIFGVDLTGVV